MGVGSSVESELEADVRMLEREGDRRERGIGESGRNGMTRICALSFPSMDSV